MKRFVVFLCLLAVLGSCVWAGPFGIEMGWALEDFEKNGIKTEFLFDEYNVSTYLFIPVNSHPDFKEYVVFIDDTDGVYMIMVMNSEVSTSKYGTEIKSLYKKIKDQISSNYGTPDETDFLHYGSIWDEPGDWMMAIRLGERSLFSIWDCKGKDSIEKIKLFVSADTTNTAALVLGYESIKSAEINKRKEAGASSVF